MDCSLSVAISTRTWRRPTNHTLMATGKWQNRSILKCPCIAQAEGRNWKSEMDNFSMICRTTPHSTAGVSPAEVSFARRIRTKLSHFEEFGIEDEVRDHDSDGKVTGKINGDCKRNACESEIQEGDKVRVPTLFYTRNPRNFQDLILKIQGLRKTRAWQHVQSKDMRGALMAERTCTRE